MTSNRGNGVHVERRYFLGLDAAAFCGFHSGGDPFTVLHWRMEPGSRIRPHAHTYGNVVTLGLTGEAMV